MGPAALCLGLHALLRGDERVHHAGVPVRRHRPDGVEGARQRHTGP